MDQNSFKSFESWQLTSKLDSDNTCARLVDVPVHHGVIVDPVEDGGRQEGTQVLGQQVHRHLQMRYNWVFIPSYFDVGREIVDASSILM